MNLSRRTALLGLATSFSVGRSDPGAGLRGDRQAAGRDHPARGARRHGRGRSLWRSRSGRAAGRDRAAGPGATRRVAGPWRFLRPASGAGRSARLCIGRTRRWSCMPSPAPTGCAAISRRRTTWSQVPTNVMTSGWLNRAVAALPAAAVRARGRRAGRRRIGAAAAAGPGAGGELGAAWVLPAGGGSVCDDRRAQPE